MTLDAERQEIETELKTNWSTTPIRFDQHKFEIEAPCLMLTIRSGEAFQASFGSPGSNIVRHSGVAIIEVVTEGGKGSTEARSLAQAVMDIFRNKTLTTIRCGIPYVMADRDEAPFYIINVAVPFTRDSFNG